MNETGEPNQPRDPTTQQAAVPPQDVDDLSRRIERAVPREPGDVVRCTRVYGSFYRCNWWTRRGVAHLGQDYDWAALLTDQIRQSRFLKATLRGDKLHLEPVPLPPSA